MIKKSWRVGSRTKAAASILFGAAAASAFSFSKAGGGEAERKPVKAGSAQARVLLWYGGVGDGSRAIDAIAQRGPWRIPASVWRAKTTFVFAPPARADRVEIDSCDGPFKEGFQAHFNFDRGSSSAEAGKAVLSFFRPRSIEGIRSLTLVSLGAGGGCVSVIRLFDGDKPVAIRVPQELEASSSDWAASLFDMRAETSLEMAKTAELSFSAERRIDRLEIWNGDQASSSAFASKPRAQTLVLEGDGGYRETIDLKDEAPPQTRALARPFRGRVLRVKATASYRGREGGAPSIAELRFFDGDADWKPSVDRALADRESELRAAFAAARLERALDRTLAADVDGDRWVARFRSDGSFYLRGFDDDVRSARSFVALGRFAVEPSKGPGLEVRLRGFRRPSNVELDGDPCGRRCVERASSSASETPFLETLRLEPIPGTSLIRARESAPRKLRALDFDRISFGLGDVSD